MKTNPKTTLTTTPEIRTCQSLTQSMSLDDRDEFQHSRATAADPILDRLPARRGKRQARGVISILDHLDREGATR